MKISRSQLINYLVDVKGFNEDEAYDYSVGDLTTSEQKDCYAYNN